MRSLLGIILITLVASALVACGPAASPLSGAVEETPSQTETPAPEPTPTPEPEEPDPYQIKPTPVDAPTPPAPKPLLPEERPKPIRFAEHPDGLEGCKALVMFQEDMRFIEYHSYCSDQLSDRVRETCKDDSGDADAARRCGEEIAGEYRSVMYHSNVARCVGISDYYERSECIEDAFSDMGKALDQINEAWGKILIGGNRSPVVEEAMKDVLSCLDSKGYGKVDRDLLLGWQRNESLSDHKLRKSRLSSEEEKLRLELLDPTNDCAKRSGLYPAQDVAWAAELRRLDKDEPDTVNILVQEGLLESLEKPGVTAYITGDLPQHVRDLDKDVK